MYMAKAGREPIDLWRRRKHSWTRMIRPMRSGYSAFNASFISGAESTHRCLLLPWFLESRVHNERCTLGSVSGRWKPAAVMPSGASARLSFVVNQFCSTPTGCSWSWTNTRGASLALACTPVMSMVWRCVECSTRLSQPGVSRNISALTTIRYSSITNGKRIFAS